MNDKKFIVTKDESIANCMLAHKFKLVSAISGTYTFINHVPEKFSFDTFDINKVHFTDKLCL